MEKINCDIINDLIPSYMDNICSQATRECVDEHIMECSKCKQLIKLYKDNSLSAKGIDEKELDGFKKIKNRIKRQNILSYGLLLILAGFGLYTFATNANAISTNFYYSLFIISMAGTYILSMNQKNMIKSSKCDIFIAVFSVIASCYGIFILYHCIISFMDGNNPFNMEAQKIGPFIHGQWGVLFTIQIIIFSYMLVRLLKKNIACQWILYPNLTGIFLLLAYVTLLRRLDTVESFYQIFIKTTGIIVGLGLIGSIVGIVSSIRTIQKNDYN